MNIRLKVSVLAFVLVSFSASNAMQQPQQVNEKKINDQVTQLANTRFNGNRISAAWELMRARPAEITEISNWFNTAPAKEWFKEFQKDHADMSNHNFGFHLAHSDKNPLSREMVINMLNIGFNPNFQIRGYRGYYSTLDLAFDYNDLDLFKRLLIAGTDPNSMNTDKEQSILERVAWKNSVSFLKALMNAGVNRNPSIIQKLENYDEMMESTNYAEIIKLLKEGFQPESLKQQSVKKMAEQIKAKKLTLEQAKEIIPSDLHPALGKLLKEMQ